MRWWPFPKLALEIAKPAQRQSVLAYYMVKRMIEMKRDEIFAAGGSEAEILACKTVTEEDWAKYEVQAREWWLEACKRWPGWPNCEK